MLQVSLSGPHPRDSLCQPHPEQLREAAVPAPGLDRCCTEQPGPEGVLSNTSVGRGWGGRAAVRVGLPGHPEAALHELGVAGHMKLSIQLQELSCLCQFFSPLLGDSSSLASVNIAVTWTPSVDV